MHENLGNTRSLRLTRIKCYTVDDDHKRKVCNEVVTKTYHHKLHISVICSIPSRIRFVTCNGQMCSKLYTFCLVFIMLADCQEGPWKKALFTKNVLIVWMVLFMSVTMKSVWSKLADSSQCIDTLTVHVVEGELFLTVSRLHL